MGIYGISIFTLKHLVNYTVLVKKILVESVSVYVYVQGKAFLWIYACVEVGTYRKYAKLFFLDLCGCPLVWKMFRMRISRKIAYKYAHAHDRLYIVFQFVILIICAVYAAVINVVTILLFFFPAAFNFLIFCFIRILQQYPLRVLSKLLHLDLDRYF